MIDQNASSDSRPSATAEPKSDARDLLARLYREIGISAVAAALSVTNTKDNDQEATADRSSPLSTSNNDMAA
jgi:hypothetical protein